MVVRKHTTLSGAEIDLEPLRATQPSLVGWLLTETARTRSWVSLQQRTAEGVISNAKKRAGDRWAEDPLYLLQLDLVGQVGVACGELRGETTPTFGALLLEGETLVRRGER